MSNHIPENIREMSVEEFIKFNQKGYYNVIVKKGKIVNIKHKGVRR